MGAHFLLAFFHAAFLGVVATLASPSALLRPEIAAFLGVAFVWTFGESWAAPPGSRPTAQTSFPIVHGIALAFTSTLGVVSAAANSTTLAPELFLSGIVIALTGVVLRILAITTLKEWFLDDIVILKGQPIISHGIYRFMRHPAELGTLAVFTGASVLLQSSAMLLATAFLLVPFAAYRIRAENRLVASLAPVHGVRA